MSVSLNATLQTAQDGADHAPRCKIVSSSFAGDIPYTGTLFNDGSSDETDPAMIATSTGRIAAVHVRGNDLYYVYSDTDRTVWDEELIYDGDDAGHPVTDCCLIELAGGYIGVVLICKESTTYLYYMIIDQTGTVLTGATLIESWSSSYTIDGPALCEISTGFMLVYKHLVSSTYSIYRRTCDATFTSWGADAAVSISGISTSYDTNHCSLLAAASGRKYMFWDYVDAVDGDNQRRNIYYSYSTDDGASWAAAAQLTAYSDYTASGVHPCAAEQSGGDIIVAYHEDVSVLTIDENTTGWCVNSDPSTGNYFLVTRAFYIAASGKLIVFGRYTAAGTKYFHQMLVVDVATWTIDKCYNQQGSPGFNAIFANWNVWTESFDADGQYAVFGVGDGPLSYHMAVVDIEADTVTQYHFADNATYGVSKNVDYTWQIGQPVLVNKVRFQLDADNDRLYFCRIGNDANSCDWEVVYIDLTDTADAVTGYYSCTYLCHNAGGPYSSTDGPWFRIFPDEDKLLIGVEAGSSIGALYVYTLSTGAQHKYYTNSGYSGFWYEGLSGAPVLTDNRIYAPIGYDADHGQSARRGLMVIDMDTDAITYERPTYASIDDYALGDLQLVDTNTRIIMAGYHTTEGGVIFYDIATQAWTRYNSENVAGFLDYESVSCVAYDEDDDLIFCADHNRDRGQEKIIAFKAGGSLYLGKYIAGTVNGDAYDFASAATLHNEYGGHDLAVAYDENDSLWNIWPTYDGSEYSMLWAQVGFSPDLAPYVPSDAPVEITWEIGKPATAAFSLSRGDLFDPTNSASIYSVLCAKGRKITISFGEAVAGTTYWQQQGEFVVTGAAITYTRPQHPVITVQCEDLGGTWDQLVVTATEGYWNATPGTILADLLETMANLDNSQYDIPTLSTFHNLYIQWVDESLRDIVDDILNHFGAFGHFGTDGVYTLRQIDLTAEVDHDYTADDTSPVYAFTPDDSNSSHINRVIVKCEGRDNIEVLWDEQRIDTLNGTVGFWSTEDSIRAYYSKDGTRRCRNPRLYVLQSINDYSAFIQMLGGQGDEYISDEDPDETYCDITIEAPNRGLYVFGFAAAVAGFGAAALGCEARFTCGVSILLTNLALAGLIQSLAAANYRYDLYAKPVGYEKEMYQATANDTEYQNQLNGLVVAHEIEDTLAYTVGHCQTVADHELAVAMAQRRRVRFTKAAHLQDEIGDMLKVLHPVSGADVQVYVAKLTRTFGAGRFDDTIEGWRITG